MWSEARARPWRQPRRLSVESAFRCLPSSLLPLNLVAFRAMPSARLRRMLSPFRGPSARASTQSDSQCMGLSQWQYFD